MGQNQALSWNDAIQRVLEEERKALHYSEITDRILERGLRSTTGATPAATVNSQVVTSIKRKGDASPYVRVAPGTFALRGVVSPAAEDPSVSFPTESVTAVATLTTDDVADDVSGLIQAFGMYWERSAVHWQAATQLLGRYDRKSKTVDFANQTGVYLLFDGRDVVYAGRTGMRQSGEALARRLYEHTEDRLKGRWDRFSWFGLRSVHDDGKIGPVAASRNTTEASLIATLEALLIEAFEPPQNRKRGDTLRDREFIQVEDPEVEARRAKAFLMSKL